jgi:hypothetical protein
LLCWQRLTYARVDWKGTFPKRSAQGVRWVIQGDSIWEVAAIPFTWVYAAIGHAPAFFHRGQLFLAFRVID